MKLSSRISTIWGNFTLLSRIVSVVGTIWLLASIVMVGVIVYQQRNALIESDHLKARRALLLASPIVAEQVLIGDYAAIKQMLERQATVYPEIAMMNWRWTGHKGVMVNVAPSQEQPPGWFRRLIDIPAQHQAVPISLGGISYGELEIRLDPGIAEHKLWHDSLGNMFLILGAASGLLIVLLVILRANTAALMQMARTADRFREGQHNARLELSGSREVRSAAMAFNGMAESMQQLFVQLSDSQRKLHEQLHFTEALIEALPVPMFYADSHGVYVSVNRAWEDFFGVTRTQAIGKTEQELFAHEPGMAAFLAAKEVELQSMQGRQIFEVAFRGRGGSEIQAVYSKALLSDMGDRVSGVIGTVIDLTELKHAEQMASEALIEKSAAERLARVKSEFLANMSHEIRTPLNAVLGLAQIGSRENAGRKSGETFVRIVDAGQHLLAVINDILDFSKLEAGRLKVEKLPFELNAVIRNVVNFVSSRAEAKKLQLSITLAENLPEWVAGDALRLAQILTNLLSNAIKFTEHGDVRLRVASENGHIFFRVIDTGIGMSDEQLGRLFTPFEQADSSTTRQFGGTGLGLAISRDLARLMGGDIDVESKPGAGSSFSLHLALAEVAAPEQVVNVAAGSGPQLAGISVLAAEDVEVNRLILADLLENQGAKVTFVENGLQAIERIHEAGAKAFDVVLMDIQMPVMDGFEATAQLRQLAPALPVIGLTAHAMAEEREKCLAAGMRDHVAKPIDINKLIATVLRHAPAGLVRKAAEPAGPGQECIPGVERVSRNPVGILDWQMLVARFKGNMMFLRKLAGSVLQSHGQSPAKLREAAERHDLPALAFMAHSCKGLGGNLMARPVYELASMAEISARNGNESDAIGHALQLIPLVDAMLMELSAYIENADKK